MCQIYLIEIIVGTLVITSFLMRDEKWKNLWRPSIFTEVELRFWFG
jgi:hypothetical protein